MSSFEEVIQYLGKHGVLVKVAEEKLRSYGINDVEVLEETKQLILNGAKTFRDVNRIVTQRYIEWIARKFRF